MLNSGLSRSDAVCSCSGRPLNLQVAEVPCVYRLASCRIRAIAPTRNPAACVLQRGGSPSGANAEQQSSIGGRPSRQAPRRGGTQRCRSSASQAKVSVLPAGGKQVRVQLPGCLVSVTASEVESQLEAVCAAVAAGATAVVLTDSVNGDGGELYDAACRLRDAIRGRAPLLVLDRTDIVVAAEADGVLLSTKGVPTVVARRMVGGADALVACCVDSAEQAVVAAADGANVLVLQGDADVAAAKQQKGGAIPVFVSLAGGDGDGDGAGAADLRLLHTRGADGVLLSIRALQAMGGVGVVLEALTAPRPPAAQADARRGAATAFVSPSPPERLAAADAERDELLEAERQLLTRILEGLRDFAPGIEENSLLEDALLGLDELFLLVVVGEFNSGKSAMINALLGRQALSEGILPTTNEISVLKYAAPGQEADVQESDGFYTRYLSSDLLRDINIVDTPGTNVILERQQRLTEEFVPRADLVLFVLSADRPFTESEVRFLKYIRQWGKKVVFVVNKVDLLAGEGEVAQVAEFVADNARRLLGVDAARVLPVSSRAALAAKSLHSGSAEGVFASLSSTSPLSRDEGWQRSGFGALEAYVCDFLTGGAGNGEGMRLKLQTPLFIADALLNAAGQQVAADLENAQQEAAALRLVRKQLSRFESEMTRDGAVQRSEVGRLVADNIAAAEALVDETLQLSNANAMTTFLLGSKDEVSSLRVSREFEAGVLGSTLDRLRALLTEHTSWLNANCSAQLQYYSSFMEERAAEMGTSLGALGAVPQPRAARPSVPEPPLYDANGDLMDPEDRQAWRVAHALSTQDASDGPVSSLLVMETLPQPRALAEKLEDEMRDAVVGTAGSAAGATALGFVATWFLPSTWEDLLALALGGAIGYSSLLNLPLRRADAKRKLNEVATGFLKDVEGAMQAELDAEVSGVVDAVSALVQPLEEYVAGATQRLRAAEARRAALVEELEAFKKRAAGL